MPEMLQTPQSLLVVTNLQSRAFMPSEACQPEFAQWAHEFGAHLYLVLGGPLTEIIALDEATATVAFVALDAHV